MKIKLSEILEINSVLKYIIDDSNLKIDAVLKFKLLGILKKIEVPVANFDVIRNDKIREYGTQDENGNISIPNDDTESIANFKKDIDNFIQTDVDIDIEPIKAIDIFNKGIPADYLIGLYAIIGE